MIINCFSIPTSRKNSPRCAFHTRNTQVNYYTNHPLPQLSFMKAHRATCKSSAKTNIYFNTPSTARCSSTMHLIRSTSRVSFRFNRIENSINKFLGLCKSASNTANNSFEKKIEKSREQSDKLAMAVNYVSDFHPAQAGKVTIKQLMNCPMQITDKILSDNEKLETYRYRHERSYLHLQTIKVLWKKRPFRCNKSSTKCA